MDLGSSDSRKVQAPPAIEGFPPLVLALPAVAEPASSLRQEGTAIVLTIRGLSGLTRSDRYYTPEELEKRGKKIAKGTTKPVRNRITIKEAEEFLKIVRNSEYSVIQQLNKLPA
ncbi:hypothetical protein SO802_009995 [Lithocarpus litseifolius]|uniref:Uncharacterized protein n=1 Tax=Lithocarpus litseifolius TaxID=425828 RepID=A0AAW2DD03_9ROSI